VDFLTDFSQNSRELNYTEIRPVRAALIHTADMKKLTGSFGDYANVLEKKRENEGGDCTIIHSKQGYLLPVVESKIRPPEHSMSLCSTLVSCC